MCHSLLVPLDGTPFAEQALQIACMIARRADAVLHLVHVGVASTEHSALSDMSGSQPKICSEQARAYLDRLREEYARRWDVSINSLVIDAPNTRAETIASAIVAQLRALQVDLLVMSTHGRSGLARLWLGSVADALIRRAPVPVLAIRPREMVAENAIASGVRRILIPLDGSTEAEAIVMEARRLGAFMESEYILFHVVSPFILVPPLLTTDGGAEGPDFVEQRYATAERYLSGIAGQMRADGLLIQPRIIVAPDPATAILTEACREQVDLVAMTTHGRSGVERVLRGSVAGKVLSDTTIPLLLYRPQASYRTLE